MIKRLLSYQAVLGGMIVGSVLTLSAGFVCDVFSGNGGQALMTVSEPVSAVDRLDNRFPRVRLQPETGVLVPLEQDERALMLTATLDHKQTSRFILDTGATYTAISSDLARRLGYDLNRASHVIITTANGQVSVPKIMLKSVTLNGYTVHNLEATVMPMPANVPFSGLIGLNFIKRYRVTIDSAADHLVLEPSGDRPDP